MLILYVLSNVFKHQILVKKIQFSLSTGTVQTQNGGTGSFWYHC